MNYSWIGNENQTVLHLLFSELHEDEDKCVQFANALLNLKVDPNVTSCLYGGTFVHTAIYKGYSARTIYTLINLACRRNLDVNIQNKQGDTVLHSLITHSDCSGYNVLKVYDLVKSKGFNYNILNAEGLSVLDLFEASTVCNPKRTKLDIQEFKRKINELKEKKFIETCKDLEVFGVVMNLIKYNTSPTVGREYEVEKLGIALCQKNRSVMLIGDSGVGKTAIVEQFAYDIQNNNVPRALRDKIILEVSPTELVAGKNYVGDFEKIIKDLVNMCLENDVILFIDEIHTLFGTGSHSNSKVDMAQMLKKYLGRTSLKVIGTTTNNEFDKYFYSDALKRRFTVIDVKELDREKLERVIEKEMVDLGNEYMISSDRILGTNVIDVLLDLTDRKNLVYGDTSRNPDLAISIVQTAFAKALYDEADEINSDHIEYSINECGNLKEHAKEEAIDNLNYDCKADKQMRKIIPFNDKKY